MLPQGKIPAISYYDAQQYGCPLCGLSFFPDSDRSIGINGYFKETCHDDDQSNMDASGGCNQSYYVYLPGREGLLPKDAHILSKHPRHGHPVHDDGQSHKNDSFCDQIKKDLYE